MRLLRKVRFILRFAWYLWHNVREDGGGHKIDPWYALTWAADFKWWGINESEF